MSNHGIRSLVNKVSGYQQIIVPFFCIFSLEGLQQYTNTYSVDGIFHWFIVAVGY